jgi:exosortase family protein XrtF
MKSLLVEFKPSLVFIARFLVLYLVTNAFYLFWLTRFRPAPDPVTHAVTNQTSWLLNGLGYSTSVLPNEGPATVSIVTGGQGVVSVYEGCNGINVVIVFLSFLIALGPWQRQLFSWAVFGVILIHMVNLARIAGLFAVALHFPSWLYFSHKYMFTLAIYSTVFLLWFLWVRQTRHQL